MRVGLRRGVAVATLLLGLSIVVIVFFAWGLKQTDQAGPEKRIEQESNGSGEKETDSETGTSVDTGDSERISDVGRAGTVGLADATAAERGGARSGVGAQPGGQVGEDAQPKHWLLQPRPSRCVSKRGWTTWPWQVFAQWRPDGREVLFSQGPELYAVTADGGAVRRVAQAWRPITASRPANPRVVDAESARSVGTMFPFDISPDGEQLMFVTCTYQRPGSTPTRDGFVAADYEYELARVPVAGGEPERITRNLVFDGHPSWSPDGRRVAFVQGWEGRRLSTVAADGSDLRGIVEAPEGSQIWRGAPAWSPDGEHLAFIARAGDRSGGLYVVPSAGSELLQLADLRPLTMRSGRLAWSPDGRRLAFSRRDDRGVGLYTIAADGTDERRLTSFFDPRLTSRFGYQGRIRSLAWSPDGAKILLIANPDLWDHDQPLARPVVVDATDGRQAPIELPFPQPGNYQLAWQPRAAAWAPDGSRIAVLAELDARQIFDMLDTFPVWPVTLLSVAPDGSDVRVLAQSRLGDNPRYERANDDYGPTMTPNGPGVCAAGVAIPDPAENPELVRDCMVLLEIRHVLQGESFLHWIAKVPVRTWTDLPMRPMHEWPGVDVGGSPLRIRALVLEGLGGTIPPELAQLTALVRLDLSSGYLEGPIPAELGDLAALELLDLSGNRLTGPIPGAFGRLLALRHLDLSKNQLTGSIPPESGQLANLPYLDLSQNQLTGPIPGELSQMAGLREVRLAGNDLTGCVPAGLPVMDRAELGLPDCEAAA